MLALAIMVTFGFTYSRAGASAAWFAGLALLLFPRFVHGRVPTLDMTVAATTTAFLLCFWHLHRKPGWRAPVMMGLVFGFAPASKLNAPLRLDRMRFVLAHTEPLDRAEARQRVYPPDHSRCGWSSSQRLALLHI